MQNSKSKVVWRMVKTPGVRGISERKTLCDILRRGVESAGDDQNEVRREVIVDGGDADEQKDNGRVHLEVDINEGVENEDASGEFPTNLDPNEHQSGKKSSEENVTIDMDMDHPPSRKGVIEYGKSVRSIVRRREKWTVTLWDGETVSCDVLVGRFCPPLPHTSRSSLSQKGIAGAHTYVPGADGMFSIVRRTLHPPRPGTKDQGFKSLPWTIINLRTETSAVRDWVKDYRGMNMVFGKGWSAAFMPLTLDIPPSTPTLPSSCIKHPMTGKEKQTLQTDSRQNGQIINISPTIPTYLPSIEPDFKQVPSQTTYPTYVALTIPNPTISIRDTISSLPTSSSPTSFLHSILHDPALDTARSFPLWTSRRTVVGGHCAVLIGDASHGMVPYCGAGASAGIKDAVDLVELLKKYIANRPSEVGMSQESQPKVDKVDTIHSLGNLLDQYGQGQIQRNDPLINQSRKVLWLVQGERRWKRMIRAVVLWGLERSERISPKRRKAEKEMKNWLESQNAKIQTS